MKRTIFITLLLMFQVIYSYAKSNINSSISKEECLRCNIEIVRKTKDKLNTLQKSDIQMFLCTFTDKCSASVEYSEFSNKILFVVLERYPQEFVELIATIDDLDIDYIYSELESPLLDIDGITINKKLLEVKENDLVKEKIIKCINKAMEY